VRMVRTNRTLVGGLSVGWLGGWAWGGKLVCVATCEGLAGGTGRRRVGMAESWKSSFSGCGGQRGAKRGIQHMPLRGARH